MKKKFTYEQIASDYKFWQEYADPEGLETEAEFNKKSLSEKIAFLVFCFGKEGA